MKQQMLRRVLLLFTIVFVGFVSWVQKDVSHSRPIAEVSEWGVATTSGTIAETTAVVSRVIDGDTIELSTGKKVRYIGIDTAELTDGKRGTTCFGREAMEENTRLVLGQTVRLEKDVSETDSYGRLLRYVYVGDMMVNEALVQHGFAQVATYPPDVRYQDRFSLAGEQARRENNGLWKKCDK